MAELTIPINATYPPDGRPIQTGLLCYVLEFGAEFKLEFGQELPVGVEVDEEKMKASVTQQVAENVEAQFGVEAIVNALGSADSQSLSSIGSDIVVSAGLTRKFGDNFSVAVSYSSDKPLCFLHAKWVLVRHRFPDLLSIDLGGRTVPVTLTITDSVTLHFGPSRSALRRLASRLGVSAVRQLFSRLAVSLGSEEAIAIYERLAYALAGIAGGLTVAWLSGLATSHARTRGQRQALAHQFAQGFMGVLWVRIGTAYAEGDFDRALGVDAVLRRDLMSARARGAEVAVQAIQRAGGGLQGARVVRWHVFRVLGLDGISVTRPQESQRLRAVMRLADYLVDHDHVPVP